VKEQIPGTKYILLESMPLDKNTSRNIHMLTVTEKKNEFKLGRGHESEVRINDISVSRCHAIIKCKKDGFYIEDNCSKFGTIVLLKNNLQLEEDHTMAVQVGRTVLSFTIKSIDLDKRMREKLKREIGPLLNRTKEAEKKKKEEETKQSDLLAIEGDGPVRGLSQGPSGQPGLNDLIRRNMID
jgi:pSer/pThr/pTyr-binding forkhead associated (FHA) protein